LSHWKTEGEKRDVFVGANDVHRGEPERGGDRGWYSFWVWTKGGGRPGGGGVKRKQK